jgi:hypothetical protein
MLVAAAIVPLLLVAAACDDDDDPSPARTPAAPAATVAPTPRQTPDEGTATARAQVGDADTGGEEYAFSGGTCTRGANDEYAELLIGEPGADYSFGIAVGPAPTLTGGTRPAAGGGEFTGTDVTLSIYHDGDFLGPSATSAAQTTATIASDLNSGEFTLVDGQGRAVSGSYRC